MSSTPAPSRTGSGRSLNQRIRGLSSDVDLARVRESSSATPRSRGQLSHTDVLARYRQAAAAPAPAADSGATESRISAARRDAAARAAEARTAAARQQQAEADAARTEARVRHARERASAEQTRARVEAARRDQAEATETRVREAREKAAAEQTRARVEAARRDKTASNEARTQAARQKYQERVRAARESMTPATGGPLVTDARGPSSGVWGSGHDDFQCGGYYNDCYWGYWGSCWSYGWCNWWCMPSYYCGLWWNTYWWYGGSWCYPWNFYWYGPFLPRTSSVVYYEQAEPEVIYVEVPAEEEVLQLPVDEAAPAAPAFVPPAQQDPAVERELNRATGYYLTQGDRAFREGRYGDAAHFYAKALEYSPDSGILYLVLSDALFATGDYRYAAFAIRKALELEPELASSVLDKRDFYAIPGDFDRQIATLERFVGDHVIDDDARLVLAANYLFGGRPAAAVDLFQSPFSLNLVESPAGALILEAARAAQLGQPVEVPALEAAPADAAVDED